LPIPRKPADLVQDYLRDLPVAQPIWEVIADYACLPINPRKIKSYANLLLRYVPWFSDKLVGPSSERTANLIVIFSCLYHFHPDLYRLVEAYPEFYEQLSRWAEQDPTQIPHPIFNSLTGIEFDVLQPPSGWTKSSTLTGSSQTTPTASIMWQAAFADPAEGNVLRIQKLIRDVGSVPVSEVEEYLVR
jgi:hypothetical protein